MTQTCIVQCKILRHASTRDVWPFDNHLTITVPNRPETSWNFADKCKISTDFHYFRLCSLLCLYMHHVHVQAQISKSEVKLILEQCNPWPHVANRRISISQLLSLWRHSHYDVLHLQRSQPPFSLWHHSLLSWPRRFGRMYVRYVQTPYRV